MVFFKCGFCTGNSGEMVFQKEPLKTTKAISFLTPDGNPKLNGRWSLWHPWSTCSETCGGGVQTRIKSCTNPEPRNGGDPCTNTEDVTQELECTMGQCPGMHINKSLVSNVIGNLENATFFLSAQVNAITFLFSFLFSE